MKISFRAEDPNQIWKKISDFIATKDVSKYLNLDVSDNTITISLSKFGTSTFVFNRSTSPGFLEFELLSEKIAFTHKPYVPEMLKLVRNAVQAAGGIFQE